MDLLCMLPLPYSVPEPLMSRSLHCGAAAGCTHERYTYHQFRYPCLEPQPCKMRDVVSLLLAPVINYANIPMNVPYASNYELRQ